MKKVILIAGAFAVVLVAGLAGMLYWLHGQLETERNRNKTAQARKARWADRDQDPGDDDQDPAHELADLVPDPSQTESSLSQKIPAGGMN